MRGVAITSFGGPERLREMEVEEHPLTPDGVRIRVAAAGVNPVDVKIREGAQADSFPYFFPAVLGWDAAGVIEETGPAVVGFEVGDEVLAYCRKDFVGQGAYAERVAVPARQVAHCAGMPAEEAAGLPLAGLTAYQSLTEAMELAGGETVLIRGASGGVGSFAVQIAASLGARVVAVAGLESEDFVRGLGADEFIDYRSGAVAGDVTRAAGGTVDALLDLVGGEQLEAFAALVRDGGRIVSTLEPVGPHRWAERSIRSRFLYVRPDGDQLAELVGRRGRGELQVRLSQVLPLGEAGRAHELLEAGGVHGKLVLRAG